MKYFFTLMIFLLACSNRTNTPLEFASTFDANSKDFNCHLKYLDAIFLNQTSVCLEPAPILISESNSFSPSTDTEVYQVISFLDSICDRNTTFEFNLGYFGALITNYSDSLYLEERQKWLNTFNEKIRDKKGNTP